MNEQAVKRPLSPRLSVYRWRLPMIASLAHRASGLVLIAALPLYLWFLVRATGDAASFAEMQRLMHMPLGAATLWLVGVALGYHLFNGIRFLCVDAGWLESRRRMRASAAVVLAAAAGLALLLGWGLG